MSDSLGTSPNATGHLTEAQAKTLHSRLLEEQQKILDLYNKDVRAGQNSVGDSTDDIADQAAMASNRELSFSLSNSERVQLRQIEEALQRMADGGYGVCQHCQEPIVTPRLEVVPWAQYCIEHQELAEQGLLGED